MSALREILAHFGVEVDDHEVHEAAEGIDGLIEKLKHFGEAVAVAFMAKELFEFASGMAEAAVEVEHSAAAFGLSTEEMQQWQLAAKASGVSTETLDTSFKMLAKNVGAGTGPGVEALRKLGVNVKDANGQVRPMGDLFEDAGAAIGTMANAGERAAAGQAVFGRQFIKLIPLLSKGKEGMEELRAKLAELGGGFDEAFIEKSKEVEEQSAFLGQAWTSLKVTLAAYLLPALTWLTTKGVELVKTMIDLAKNTESVKAAIAMLAIAGAAALGPLIAEFAGLLIPAAALAAIFLALQDFFTFLAGGDSEFGDLMDKMFGEGSAEIVRKFFTDIKKGWDDLGMGFSSLGLLAQYVWNAIKNAALYAAAYASDAFADMFAAITNWSQHAGASIKDAFGGAFDAILDGIKSVMTSMSNIPGLKGLAEVAKNINSGGHSHHVYDLEQQGPVKGGRAVADLDAVVAAEKKAIGTAQLQIQNGGGAGDTHVKTETNITVHVPPGTPQQQARALADAAAQGANKGAQSARSTHAATAPGKG